MKYILTLLTLTFATNTFSQSNPNYNKTLSEKLGADDYGMKSYILVMLKTRANATENQELINESFHGHIENMERLVEEGKLIVAGPLRKNEGSFRGVFTLDNLKGIDESKELLKTDPAIINGLLDYDIYNWNGSAALPEYLQFSDKIWKSKS